VDSVPSRATPLGGFWAFLAGGVALLIVLIVEQPIVDPARCPNAGGAGNASAFADPAWDLYLPMLVLGWLILVALEQVFPTTWRHRSASAVTLRAALALTLVVVASCVLLVPLETVCR
jgi:hypothetical protein